VKSSEQVHLIRKGRDQKAGLVGVLKTSEIAALAAIARCIRGEGGWGGGAVKLSKVVLAISGSQVCHIQWARGVLRKGPKGRQEAGDVEGRWIVVRTQLL